MLFVEIISFVVAFLFGVIWFFNPDGNYEPLIVILLIVPGILEIIRRRRKHSKEVTNQLRIKKHKSNTAGNGKYILIVDDDAFFLKDVASVLELKGIEVLTSNKVEKAEQTIKKLNKEIDIVVLDVMMCFPEKKKRSEIVEGNLMAGIELGKWILKNYPHIQIVGCSLSSRSSEYAKWFVKNTSGFIEKPFLNNNVLESFISEVRGTTS